MPENYEEQLRRIGVQPGDIAALYEVVASAREVSMLAGAVSTGLALALAIRELRRNLARLDRRRS